MCSKLTSKHVGGVINKALHFTLHRTLHNNISHFKLTLDVLVTSRPVVKQRSNCKTVTLSTRKNTRRHVLLTMAQRMMKFGSRMAAAVPALTVKLGAQSKGMCNLRLSTFVVDSLVCCALIRNQY